MRRLTNGEKREFYAGLARLLRSGSALPIALDLLARDTPRGVGQFLRGLNRRIKAGEPLGDALLHQPGVTELEASIVTAATRGGRLDRGCDQLARYFEALKRAGGDMFQRMLYPLLVLHGGIFMVNIRFLFTDGIDAYLRATLRPLAVIYAAAAVIWLAWLALNNAARSNVTADAVLAWIPGVGPIRKKFALARFFATLDAQLEAGVNIWEAFANAAKTSDSARIITAARQAMPMLQAGERLSEALARKKVLPVEYIRTFRVAESAGDLNEELTALAAKSEESAVAALNRWSQWLPRVLYGLVVCFMVYQIVLAMQAYLAPIKNFDPFNQ